MEFGELTNPIGLHPIHFSVRIESELQEGPLADLVNRSAFQVIHHRDRESGLRLQAAEVARHKIDFGEFAIQPLENFCGFLFIRQPLSDGFEVQIGESQIPLAALEFGRHDVVE